jgi:hypothetical protein
MTTNVKLGVAFDLNGTAIALEPKQAINKIQEEGIELKLPDNVQSIYLGTAGQGINSILENFGSTYRVNDNSIPDPNPKNLSSIEDQLPEFKILKDTYNKVISAELYVEKFKVKIPGSNDKKLDPNVTTQYTIGMSAKWTPDATSKDSTGLTLTGIYLEISNEGTKTTTNEGTETKTIESNPSTLK